MALVVTPPPTGTSITDWIAAAGGVSSFLLAVLAYWYAHTVRRPIISLGKATVNFGVKASAGNPFPIARINVPYKNAGQVAGRLLRLRVVCVARSGLSGARWETDSQPASDVLPPDMEGSFVVDLMAVSGISELEEGHFSNPEKVKQWFGAYVLAIRFDYRGLNRLVGGRRRAFFYLAWNGDRTLWTVTKDDYETDIKQLLPQEMHCD